jgi:hypothetical protein
VIQAIAVRRCKIEGRFRICQELLSAPGENSQGGSMKAIRSYFGSARAIAATLHKRRACKPSVWIMNLKIYGLVRNRRPIAAYGLEPTIADQKVMLRPN